MNRQQVSLCLAVALAVAGFFYLRFRTSSSGEGSLQQTQGVPRAQTSAIANAVVTIPKTQSAEETNDSDLERYTLLAEPPSESNETSRQILASFTQIDLSKPLGPEEAQLLRHRLKSLAAQGKHAIPAIREFLNQQIDIEFGSGELSDLHSLRYALLQALHQMDGPEARWTLAETLRTTSVPGEIAKIASYLEEEAPGQFRSEVGKAATETLALAANGELTGWDVGPLFHVLQTYTPNEARETLEKNAEQWTHYSSLALANLPAGEGIPGLVRLAESENAAARPAAIQALAQSSFFYPEASAALVRLARAGKIRQDEWPIVAEALSGEQHFILNTEQEGTPVPENPGVEVFHIGSSNERYFSLTQNGGGMSSQQIDERLAIIDQLIDVPADAQTISGLREAREKLLQSRVEPGGTSLTAH